MKRIEGKRGQMLLDPLLAITILGFFLIISSMSLSTLLTARVGSRHKIEASQYTQEGLEVAYNLAVNTSSWADYKGNYLGDVFHPDTSGNTIALISGEEHDVDGRFSRMIEIKKARRSNLTGNITTEDDIDSWLDENTLEIVCVVTWQEKDKDQEVKYKTYVINFSDE